MEVLSLLVVLVLVTGGLGLIYYGFARRRNRPDEFLPYGVVRVWECYANWDHRYNVRASGRLPALFNVCLLGGAPNTIGEPDNYGYVLVLDATRNELLKHSTLDKRRIHRISQEDLYPFYHNFPLEAQPPYGMLHFTLDGQRYKVSCGVQVNPLDVVGIPGINMFLRIPVGVKGETTVERISLYEPLGNVWWATPE